MKVYLPHSYRMSALLRSLDHQPSNQLIESSELFRLAIVQNYANMVLEYRPV
jgi:hypothetical protein